MLGAAALAAAAPTGGDVPVKGCPRDIGGVFTTRLSGGGPLRLAGVTCVDLQAGASVTTNPFVSPDGRRAAQWSDQDPWPVRIATLDQPGLVSISNRVAFRNFAGLGRALFGGPPDALAWSSDSRSLWSVRQETVSPYDASSGLRPIRIGVDGKLRPLPALRHKAGPLDALLWVGGDGLALAQFGTRGGYYRPEHDDPSPTFAMVDVAQGRVLDAWPARQLPALRNRPQAYGQSVALAAATILPDGRLRAVLSFIRRTEQGSAPEPIEHPGLWLLWTQGEAPMAWLDPPADKTPMALSPDGSALLVSRPLYPGGVWIVGCRIRCKPGPPPPPVSGPVAELIDLATRLPLWRIDGRAIGHWSPRTAPAISADRRHALIELPPEGDRLPVALVSMRDGRILQRILAFEVGSYPQTFGFVRGGRQVWLAGGNVILTFELGRR